MLFIMMTVIVVTLMMCGLYVAYNPSTNKTINTVEFLSMYSVVLAFHETMFPSPYINMVCILMPVMFGIGLLVLAKLVKYI